MQGSQVKRGHVFSYLYYESKGPDYNPRAGGIISNMRFIVFQPQS